MLLWTKTGILSGAVAFLDSRRLIRLETSSAVREILVIRGKGKSVENGPYHLTGYFTPGKAVTPLVRMGLRRVQVKEQTENREDWEKNKLWIGFKKAEDCLTSLCNLSLQIFWESCCLRPNESMERIHSARSLVEMKIVD